MDVKFSSKVVFIISAVLILNLFPLFTEDILGQGTGTKTQFVTFKGKNQGKIFIEGRAGTHANGLKITLYLKDTTKKSWWIIAKDDTFTIGKRNAWGWDPKTKEFYTVKDAYLWLPSNLKYYIHPNLFFYEYDMQLQCKKNRDQFPLASQHLFEVILIYREAMVEFWIDGRFVDEFDLQSQPEKVVLTAYHDATGHDAKIDALLWEPLKDHSRFLPIKVKKYSRAASIMDTVTLPSSLESTLKTKYSDPMDIVDPKQSIDVGLSRILIKNPQAYGDSYHYRSAFDGIRETIIFSVPKRQYIYAHVVCAVEDNPQKARVLTARLTRSCPQGGRGDAVADTIIHIPGNVKEFPENMHHLGDMTISPGKTLPLYYIRIPLKVGEIQDLLFSDKRGMWGQGNYLDFELTRGINFLQESEWSLDMPEQGKMLKKFRFDGKPSAVHVLGLTLEESPVTMICQSFPGHTGNVFYPDENAGLQVKLINKYPAGTSNYKLQWTSIDFWGEQSTPKINVITFSPTVKEMEQEIYFTSLARGWHGVRLRLLDITGKESLVTHYTAIALVPADTRKMLHNSPFGANWFTRYSGSANNFYDLAKIGPLYERAGLRRFGIPTNLTVVETAAGKKLVRPIEEKDLQLYNGTLSSIPWAYRMYNKPYADWETVQIGAIDDIMTRFPNCKLGMIFHEDGGPAEVKTPEWFPFPPELLDKTPPTLKPFQEEIFDEHFWKKASNISAYYRKNYPGVKLLFGNSWWSGHMCAEFFRRGYPKNYIDYLGVEMRGQTIMPEKLREGTTQGMLLLRLTAEKFGYKDIPIAPCIEWIGRKEIDLGKKTQADWYMRDCLLALSYKAGLINPASIFDHIDSYYHSGWGGGHAHFTRYPLLAPRPWYAAMAVLTNVLDSASFKRTVPTDSKSLYALEFGTPKGLVYALWTSRGSRSAALNFKSKTDIKIIDIMGAESDKNNIDTIKLSLGTSVLYVISSSGVPLVNVEQDYGSIKFPGETIPKSYDILNPLDDPTQWKIQLTEDSRIERYDKAAFYRISPFRTRGDFNFSKVTDTDRGTCCELELKTTSPSSLPAIVFEYVVLRLNKPIEIPDKHRGLGLWVKGNSGWGQVMWEFQDSSKEAKTSTDISKSSRTWLSCGRGGYGTDMLDWPGRISINYDGWNLLKMELPDDEIENGSILTQWRGKNTVVYPLYLTGIVILMNRYVPYVNKLEPVINKTIRIDDLLAYY